MREQERRREAARIAAEAEMAREAQRAELTRRWRLDRHASRPQQEQPRHWVSREPEHVHDAQMEDRRRSEPFGGSGGSSRPCRVSGTGDSAPTLNPVGALF
ncbi:hypothetical protein [Streptomyces sp. NPDC051286]|uniref:hypothetical protein n=1 Tax=Streptomyces sp. NPDC051286 TaxID=3365647 RepID=UPI0037B75A01